MELAEVKDAIITVNPMSSPDHLAQALELLAALKERVREYDRVMNDAAVEWIKHNGELVVGDIRYYVGSEKKTKCKDKKLLLEALLRKLDGDLEAVVQHMSSEPFKPGACKPTLEDEWEMNFDVTVEDSLKEGKPKLQKVNTRFLPGKKGADHEEVA